MMPRPRAAVKRVGEQLTRARVLLHMDRIATPIAVAVLVAVAGGCAAPPRLSVPPSAAERAAAATSPESLVEGFESPTGACALANDEVDRAMADKALDRAQTKLDEARRICGPGQGSQWRAGWLARRHGEWDDAAQAFLGELTSPDPMPWTGAALLDLLPVTSRAVRKEIWKIGSKRHAIAGGWSDVARDRVASMRCEGRAFQFGTIACGRDYCRYTVMCRGGGRRQIYYGGAGDGTIPPGVEGMLGARATGDVAQRNDSTSP